MSLCRLSVEGIAHRSSTLTFHMYSLMIVIVWDMWDLGDQCNILLYYYKNISNHRVRDGVPRTHQLLTYCKEVVLYPPQLTSYSHEERARI